MPSNNSNQKLLENSYGNFSSFRRTSSSYDNQYSYNNMITNYAYSRIGSYGQSSNAFGYRANILIFGNEAKIMSDNLIHDVTRSQGNIKEANYYRDDYISAEEHLNNIATYLMKVLIEVKLLPVKKG